MKKIKILDTNVLLSDGNALYNFGRDDIIITFSVLEELDKKKNTEGIVGLNARQTIRILEKLRTNNKLGQNYCRLGKNRGILYICNSNIALNLNDNVDNRIISTALLIKKDNPNRKVSFISRDINARIKANYLGLNSENYETNKVIDNKEQIYSGFKIYSIDEQMIDKFYNKEPIYLEKNGIKLYPNQFILLSSIQNNNKTAIAKFKSYNSPLQKVSDFKTGIFGLKPRNKEQQFAMELLMDNTLPIVSLIGPAGTGKSLCATAAGLQQTLNKDSLYKRLVVMRPVQPMGKDLGYLPGSIQEKLSPYMAPIVDNLRYLLGNDKTMLDEYVDKGIIEIEALTYIRGRTISNAFIIADEFQNTNRHEMKTIMTRIGNDSKIVITGDLSQLDNPYISETSSGLTHLIEKFKGQDIYGHVTLQKGERSIVATTAAKIL